MRGSRPPVLCIEDAGIAKDDIDGLIVFGSRVEDHTRFQALLAEHLGMPKKHYTDVTKTGGTSSASAIAAIDALPSAPDLRELMDALTGSVKLDAGSEP